MLENTEICATGPFLSGVSCDEQLLSVKFADPVAPFIAGSTGTIQLVQDKKNWINAYSKTYTESFKDYWFITSPTEFSWMYGDATIYRPGLLARDLWKWDISGESDYGIIEPPINEPNYDLFDSNWSAQFLVYVRGDELNFSCGSLGLGCSHRKGTFARGASADIYSNCPANYLQPDTKHDYDPITGIRSDVLKGLTLEEEPTYMQLFDTFKAINEESKIIEHLGSSYLGCIFDDINHISSAKCPEQGKLFHKYLEYCRSSATFWDTPLDTPLQRNAQMGQLMSESIEIKISAKLDEEIKLGSTIEIRNHNTMEGHEPRRNSGFWLVATISYEFVSDSNLSLILTLVRDTLGYYRSGHLGWDSPKYITTPDWDE